MAFSDEEMNEYREHLKESERRLWDARNGTYYEDKGLTLQQVIYQSYKAGGGLHLKVAFEDMLATWHLFKRCRFPGDFRIKRNVIPFGSRKYGKWDSFTVTTPWGSGEVAFIEVDRRGEIIPGQIIVCTAGLHQKITITRK